MKWGFPSNRICNCLYSFILIVIWSGLFSKLLKIINNLIFQSILNHVKFLTPNVLTATEIVTFTRNAVSKSKVIRERVDSLEGIIHVEALGHGLLV